MAFPIAPTATNAPVAPPAQPPRKPFRWVPIRSLAARHRPRIAAHLQALGARDRYLRFGHAAGDEQITGYVDRIDFESDEIFGIFNRRLELLAMAHLAYLNDGGKPANAAEFGVSVAQQARGRGYGTRLFDLAVLHARNRGVDTMLINALSENSAMLRIARSAGAKLEFAGPDALARLSLPPEDLASHVGALVEQQVAEFDYGMKRQARRVDAWLGLFGGAANSAPSVPPDSRETEAAALTHLRGRGPPPPV